MSTTIKIDPVTRIEGHLAIEVVVDTVSNEQVVVDAKATGRCFAVLKKYFRAATRLTRRILPRGFAAYA